MSSLARRIYESAHLEGEFVLRSGAVSNEYFDKYRFEADPILLRDIAAALVPLIPDGTEVLCGLELGGVPIVTVVSQLTGMPARFVRKKAKDYGTREISEGGSVEGRRVCLIEDVITSGGAVIDATNALRDAGGKVEHVVCVIDRQAGGREKLGDIGVEVLSLFEKSDLEAAAG
jgi:orotate phosphoribosyltransferase